MLNEDSLNAVKEMEETCGIECAGYLALRLIESEGRRRMYEAVKKAFSVQEMPAGATAYYWRSRITPDT